VAKDAGPCKSERMQDASTPDPGTPKGSTPQGSTPQGSTPQRILGIDIGGSKSKGALLDPEGKWLSERHRLPTPKRATPKELLSVLEQLAHEIRDAVGNYDAIGLGFPGIVRDGVTWNAPNLGKGWQEFPLAETIAQRLGAPCRAANDADVQGMASISGVGTELVLTLGTGVGSALFRSGALIPNTELGHLPFKAGESIEERLGQAALDKRGRKDWLAELREVIEILRECTGFDSLVLGGGNAKLLEKAGELPAAVRLGENRSGITGTARLWNSPS
jgi:polyphosphate glucokinase